MRLFRLQLDGAIHTSTSVTAAEAEQGPEYEIDDVLLSLCCGRFVDVVDARWKTRKSGKFVV